MIGRRVQKFGRHVRGCIPRFFNTWIVLGIILLHLAFSWAVNARFAIPRVDGSVWGNSGVFVLTGLAGNSAFLLLKKRCMTTGEAIKAAIEVLILMVVWIVWLAPHIWDYTHVVEIDRYLKVSIAYWFAFAYSFAIGVAIAQHKENTQNKRD